MIGSRRDEEKEEDETMVAEILDKDLEGLGRPLKVSHDRKLCDMMRGHITDAT